MSIRHPAVLLVLPPACGRIDTSQGRRVTRPARDQAQAVEVATVIRGQGEMNGGRHRGTKL